MKYYHYTNENNLPAILKTKQLKDAGFGVYVCNNKMDLLKFIELYIKAGTIKIEDTVMLEFNTNTELKESFDHNAHILGGARAFVSYKDVIIQNIQIYNIKIRN